MKNPRMKARPDATRPYEELVEAIVIQAVVDYSMARQIRRTTADIDTAEGQMAEAERFFRSKYFISLTGVDGKEVLKKLKEEYL